MFKVFEQSYVKIKSFVTRKKKSSELENILSWCLEGMGKSVKRGARVCAGL